MAEINFIATYKLVGVGEELDGEGALPAADGRGRRRGLSLSRGDEALGSAADLVPALDGARAALQGAGDDDAVVAVRPHAVRAVTAALILQPTGDLQVFAICCSCFLPLCTLSSPTSCLKVLDCIQIKQIKMDEERIVSPETTKSVSIAVVQHILHWPRSLLTQICCLWLARCCPPAKLKVCREAF